MTYIPPSPLQQLSAVREWEALMRGIGALVEQAIDSTARPERLWIENGLAALIEATAHGERVGDSGYTREAALGARVFVQAFMTTFAVTPLLVDTLPDGTEIRLTPLQLLSQRSTPQL